MESEISNDSEFEYFTVHHRKNGRDKEAYFACSKQHKIEPAIKMTLNTSVGRIHTNPTPNTDTEPKKRVGF